MSVWTPTAIANEPERERAHSSCRTALIMTSAPAPPYLSSYSRPRKPSSPMRRKIGFGRRPAASHASTCGITSFSTKDRTVARNMSCCSLKTFTLTPLAGATASLRGARVDDADFEVAPIEPAVPRQQGMSLPGRLRADEKIGHYAVPRRAAATVTPEAPGEACRRRIDGI